MFSVFVLTLFSTGCHVLSTVGIFIHWMRCRICGSSSPVGCERLRMRAIEVCTLRGSHIRSAYVIPSGAFMYIPSPDNRSVHLLDVIVRETRPTVFRKFSCIRFCQTVRAQVTAA